MNPQRNHTGAGYGILAMIVALAFIVVPIALEVNGHTLPSASLAILMVFGIALLIFGGFVTTVTRLYHKTSADVAFVRTGMGGSRAVIDGGCVVIPVIHNTIYVPLRTLVFEVVREKATSLLTQDYLRADITAEFYL